MKKKTFWQRAEINFIRAFFHILTILMFAIGGVGLYYLNELTFKVRIYLIDKT